MDTKQNQPNPGLPASATNKPTNPSASANDADNSPSGAPLTPGQQPDTAPKAASKAPQGAMDKGASTAESSQPGKPQDQQRKSWLDQEELLKGVNQLPQSLKELGNKAMEQINGLSPTQKIVGGALLVSGLSWLALRGKKTKFSSDSLKPYNPRGEKGESKWKSSNESVYRGASTGQRNYGSTEYGTENGF